MRRDRNGGGTPDPAANFFACDVAAPSAVVAAARRAASAHTLSFTGTTAAFAILRVAARSASMFQRILVPTDGSTASAAAIDAAVALARSLHAEVVFFHAYPAYRGGAYGTADSARHALAEAFDERANAATASVLAAATSRAQAQGVRSECMTSRSERPWEAIIAAAKRRRCDAICMASHGRRGLAGIVLGSETAKVLTHCTVPVLVIR